jgi:hypothetical protein
VGRLLSAAAWNQLRESAGELLRFPTPSHRNAALGELGPSVAAMLVSTAIVAAADLRDEVVTFLCQDNDDLVACAISALRAARAPGPQTHREAGLDVVARHCATQLKARLARPVRAADDWSIELSTGCHCELCTTLGAFLGDPARRSFEWPLAEQRRRHIHSRIDGAELAVHHQTRRSGRPYTLVLTKTDARSSNASGRPASATKPTWPGSAATPSPGDQCRSAAQWVSTILSVQEACSFSWTKPPKGPVGGRPAGRADFDLRWGSSCGRRGLVLEMSRRSAHRCPARIQAANAARRHRAQIRTGHSA